MTIYEYPPIPCRDDVRHADTFMEIKAAITTGNRVVIIYQCPVCGKTRVEINEVEIYK
jgi:hypothetical protein